MDKEFAAADKKRVLIKLYRVWISDDNIHLRLGQLISKVFQKGEEDHTMNIHDISDEELITTIERMYRKYPLN